LNGTRICAADRIFTGGDWLNNNAVVISDGWIDRLVPVSSLEPGISIENFAGCLIAPAFIDLQIYGAKQKLLSVYPEADSLEKLKEYCYEGGAAYCLPTVATNTSDVFYRSIDAIRDYWANKGDGILGLHIEGPWINVAKRGAHMESLIHAPDINEVHHLLEYGKGVIKMITLAPEVCSKEVIDLIRSQQVIISAGHSNATYRQSIDGFSNGIAIATHLYNAMSPLQHREPGLVGAVMNDERVACSVIADGYHVNYEAIRIAKKIMGERLFAITDAVTETDKGPYQHQLAGDKYEAGGILSGSALTMNKALKNLVNNVGVSPEEALRMCSLYPAKVMGLDNQLGQIKNGHKAKLVVLDDKMNLVKMIA